MWLSVIKTAREGNSEAMNHLQVENKIRQEQNRPSVEEELEDMVEEAELRKRIEAIKARRRLHRKM